jgi:manganese transport protein
MKQTVDPTESLPNELGWRFRRTNPSLREVYGSVALPRNAVGWIGFVRKLLAFSGPGYLIAVGYMDPGNWATALAGLNR